MANDLYTLAAIGATFRPFKNMITLFNSTGSGKILKVYKIWMLNNQTVAVTGILSLMELRFITSTGGGAALTALKHNSSITSLPSQIIAAEGATNAFTSTRLRRILWSTDEPVATASTSNVIELVPKWNIAWYTPFTGNLEPIVLNENEGICIYFNTNSSVGLADFFMEFTAI